LAEHFCKMYALMYGRPAFSFSPEAEAAVLRHSWPGNVRELQNRVMRAMILAQGTTLTPSDLGFAEVATAAVGAEDGPRPATCARDSAPRSTARSSRRWPASVPWRRSGAGWPTTSCWKRTS